MNSNKTPFPAAFPRAAAHARRAAGALAPVAGLTAALLFLAGCAVGPDYRRPDVATPPAFKEASGAWKQAAPQDTAPRGAWWEVFGDPILNGLEEQVAQANQSVKEAEATYEATRQTARSAVATLFPTVAGDATAERSKGAARGVSSGSGGTVIPSVGRGATNTFSAALDGNWQLDVWGKVRRTIEADTTSAQAEAAALADARLSLQATLAQDYFQLRVLDERKRLLQNATAAYQRTLNISQNKYKAGVSARSDVLSAQAQLDANRASEIDTEVQRAEMEHAIAVLAGKPPSDLTIAPLAELKLSPPAAPAAVPSELLERRPDIAEAERNTAAANARIGIQVAAYFPTLSLTGSFGYQGGTLSNLFSAPNQSWAFAGQAADSILDWGQRHALVLSARASYDVAVATYRQTVLAAFEQVEDQLSSLRILSEEASIQQTAVREAAEAARIAENEYRAGTVDYTTVVTAEVTELTDREAALATQQNEMTASVILIEALGGGWSAKDLPAWRAVLAAHPHSSP